MVKSGNQDEAFDRLLRRALAPPGEAQGEAEGHACPDADVLGAYLEQRLPAAEASAFEAHAAACARCQQILALLAEMPLVTPAPATAPASGDERASARWWHWGWLLPAAAAAALSVAVFVALRPQPPAAEVAGGVEMSQAPVPATPAPAEAPADEAAESRAATPVERDARSSFSESPGALPPPPAVTAGPPPAPRAPAGGARPRARSTDESASRDLAQQAAKSASPAVPPAAGQDLTHQPPAFASQPPATQQAQRAEQAAAAPQAAERFAPVPKVAENAVPAPVPGVVGGAVASEVAPPPPAPATADSRRMSDAFAGRAASPAAASLVRWRVGAAGLIERTSDGGRSWRRQDAGVRADLLAAVTVSPTVAWAVGAAGTVLVTSDGERWERRAFPEATDLVAVSATRATHVTVTARDGRRFATTDAGRTWQPVR